MDKKSIIGIVLMVALFVGFSFYQSHEIGEQQKIAQEKAKIEQAERAQRIAEAEAERMLEEQMSAEERAMLGLWTRSVESEGYYGAIYGAMRQDVEFRLYEEGRGQMFREFYTDGVLLGWSRGALSYRI